MVYGHSVHIEVLCITGGNKNERSKKFWTYLILEPNGSSRVSYSQKVTDAVCKRNLSVGSDTSSDTIPTLDSTAYSFIFKCHAIILAAGENFYPHFSFFLTLPIC